MGFLQEINPFSSVKSALKRASRETGVDFDYLMKTAARESSLDPSAKASSSSATGLFQFIEQTWLKTLKEDGPALGLGQYSAKITKGRDGRFEVSDKAARREILNLRSDPAASAMMAGALTRRNHDALANGLGREPTEGELYMAHFMGGNGALRFIQVAANKPDANAADYFPREARANRAIFYSANGTPRSAGEVYQLLAAKHGAGPVEMAAGRVREAADFALAAQEGASSYLPQQPAEPQAFAANYHADGPMFHGLFGSRSLLSDGAQSSDFVAVWGSAREAALRQAVAAVPDVAPEAAPEAAPEVVVAAGAAVDAGAEAQIASLGAAPVPARRPYFRPEEALVAGAESMAKRGFAAADSLGAATTLADEAASPGAIGAPVDLAALTPGAWLRKEEGKA